MKFNIKSLEEKFTKINDISQNIKQSINNYDNKKKIETIVYTVLLILNYDFNIKKKEYLDLISQFSPAYLEGSEWYFGEDYTYEHFWDEVDIDSKYKFYTFLFIMNYFYQKVQ